MSHSAQESGLSTTALYLYSNFRCPPRCVAPTVNRCLSPTPSISHPSLPMFLSIFLICLLIGFRPLQPASSSLNHLSWIWAVIHLFPPTHTSSSHSSIHTLNTSALAWASFFWRSSADFPGPHPCCGASNYTVVCIHAFLLQLGCKTRSYSHMGWKRWHKEIHISF